VFIYSNEWYLTLQGTFTLTQQCYWFFVTGNEWTDILADNCDYRYNTDDSGFGLALLFRGCVPYFIWPSEAETTFGATQVPVTLVLAVDKIVSFGIFSMRVRTQAIRTIDSYLLMFPVRNPISYCRRHRFNWSIRSDIVHPNRRVFDLFEKSSIEEPKSRWIDQFYPSLFDIDVISSKHFSLGCILYRPVCRRPSLNLTAWIIFNGNRVAKLESFVYCITQCENISSRASNCRFFRFGFCSEGYEIGFLKTQTVTGFL